MLASCSSTVLHSNYQMYIHAKGLIPRIYNHIHLPHSIIMYSNFILYILNILISSYLFDSSIGFWVGMVLLIYAILLVICTVLVDVLLYYVHCEYKCKHSYLEDIYIFGEMFEDEIKTGLNNHWKEPYAVYVSCFV